MAVLDHQTQSTLEVEVTDTVEGTLNTLDVKFQFDRARLESAWEDMARKVEESLETDGQEVDLGDELEKWLLMSQRRQAKKFALDIERLELMITQLMDGLEGTLSESFTTWSRHFDGYIKAAVDEHVKVTVSNTIGSKTDVIVDVMIQKIDSKINEIVKAHLEKHGPTQINKVSTTVFNTVQNDVTLLVEKLHKALYARINQGEESLYHWTLAQLTAFKECSTDRQVLVEQLNGLTKALQTKLEKAPCADPARFDPWRPKPMPTGGGGITPIPAGSSSGGAPSYGGGGLTSPTQKQPQLPPSFGDDMKFLDGTGGPLIAPGEPPAIDDEPTTDTPQDRGTATEANTVDEIRKHIERHPGVCLVSDLVDALRETEERVQEALDELKKQGEVSEWHGAYGKPDAVAALSSVGTDLVTYLDEHEGLYGVDELAKTLSKPPNLVQQALEQLQSHDKVMCDHGRYGTAAEIEAWAQLLDEITKHLEQSKHPGNSYRCPLRTLS